MLAGHHPKELNIRMYMYFPLRSNIDYRDLQPLELDLESRMKLSALLFEQLIFENGVLATLIGKRLQFDLRGHDISKVPSDLNNAFSSDGGMFEIDVNGVSFQDEAVRRYYLSFDRILEENGLHEQSWVRISDIELTIEAAEGVNSLSNAVYGLLDDGDAYTKVFRRSIIGHVSYDYTLALANNWQLNLDPLHFTWLEQIVSVKETDQGDLQVPLDFEIVFPELPTLDQITWEEILEAREHSSIREMRDTLTGISCELLEAHLTGTTGMAIRNQLEAWGYRQLMSELPNLLPNRKERVRSTAVSLVMNALGLLPGLGLPTAAVSSAHEIATGIKSEQKSSHSLVAAFTQRRSNQQRWNK